MMATAIFFFPNDHKNTVILTWWVSLLACVDGTVHLSSVFQKVALNAGRLTRMIAAHRYTCSQEKYLPIAIDRHILISHIVAYPTNQTVNVDGTFCLFESDKFWVLKQDFRFFVLVCGLR
jgi:hypothetical protein